MLARAMQTVDAVPRRRPRPHVAGFSLIEAVIAAVVLGLGLAALTNAHMASMRGVENSQEGFQARTLASLVADDIALIQRDLTQTFDNFGCLNIVGSYQALEGCALPNGEGYTTEETCTRYFFPENLPNLQSASLGTDPASGLLFLQGLFGDPGPGAYRVDVFTMDHPDPSVPAGRARVVDVFVCYDDPFTPGNVKEVRETRVLFAEQSAI